MTTTSYFVSFLIIILSSSAIFIEDISYKKDVFYNITDLLLLKRLIRNIDGSGNNFNNIQWGKSWSNCIRKSPPRYEDGKSQPLTNVPNSRYLSETIGKLAGNIVIPNQFNLTMMFGTWGQFLDHDITLSDQNESSPIVQISVPRCDLYFDKKCSGKQTITYHRSKYDSNQTIRTNINQLTAWIDASMVYGSQESVSKKVRAFVNGRLKTSPGNLLPIEDDQYYAGDVRATQNMGLTTLQILFLREHNRICNYIVDNQKSNNLTDQQIFQIARNYVIGLIQKISFYDYLPNLFGKEHFQKMIGPYKGYNSSANPNIYTEFASAVYRIGHPYVPHTYKAVDNNNKTIQKISLYQLFLCSPQTLTYLRVDPILKGMSFTLAKQRNLKYVDQLRNLPPDILGRNFDLFAVNTDRNRDHGVADYNTVRQIFGLKKVDSFQEIIEDENDRMFIEASYNTIDNLDLYIGILGQKKLDKSMYGELGAKIAAQQFSNIRNGDRFWFQYQYPPDIIAQIRATSLRDIILRNTQIQNMAINPFFCHDCSVS